MGCAPLTLEGFFRIQDGRQDGHIHDATAAAPFARFTTRQTQAENAPSSNDATTSTPQPEVIDIDYTSSSVMISEHDRRPKTDMPVYVTVECSADNNTKNRDNAKSTARFRGVARPKLTKYYVGNIELDVTDDDFHEYLSQGGVKCTQLTLFNSRSADSLAAYVSIWAEHSDIVEDPSFWPEGVSCRRWVTRPPARRRRDNNYQPDGRYNQY